MGTEEAVAVLNNVAEGSTVCVASMLCVAVGVPAPVSGMMRSGSYSAAFLAPNVSHGTPNPMSALARIRNRKKYSLVLTAVVPVEP